jgi:hypothetical protein
MPYRPHGAEFMMVFQTTCVAVLSVQRYLSLNRAHHAQTRQTLGRDLTPLSQGG